MRREPYGGVGDGSFTDYGHNIGNSVVNRDYVPHPTYPSVNVVEDTLSRASMRSATPNNEQGALLLHPPIAASVGANLRTRSGSVVSTYDEVNISIPPQPMSVSREVVIETGGGAIGIAIDECANYVEGSAGVCIVSVAAESVAANTNQVIVGDVCCSLVLCKTVVWALVNAVPIPALLLA
jgi:hypothetical protein